MESKKVWFITGAGRGMGVAIAKAALAAGHAVVATGRDTVRLSEALGTSDSLLTVRLDITHLGEAQTAVRAAVDRFGRIDVLVNNAANVRCQVRSVVEALVRVGHEELKKSGVFLMRGFANFVVVKEPATKDAKTSTPSPRIRPCSRRSAREKLCNTVQPRCGWQLSIGAPVAALP
jgi:NAD(P)-dependent dehydrogenase (short-subunit alcohol dehydrogenase family)